MMLTEQQIRDLTGYRQHARQARWIAEQLKLKVPLRADGLPVLTQAQLEATVGDEPAQVSRINWNK